MVGPILVGWVVLMLSVSGLCAQEKFPVFLDAEIGAERFTASDMHSIFPVGASLKVGPFFAFGDQWRLRLRSHARVTFFSIKIAESSEEHTAELQSLIRSSYDGVCLQQKNQVIRF